MVPKKKAGRPKKMTDAIKQQSLLLISTTTKSIKSICKVIGVNHDTFFTELLTDKIFSDQYVRAKEQQAALFADELIDRARKKSSDTVAAMDKRIEIDTIKWALSKTLPKKYGDSSHIKLQGQDASEPIAPIRIETTSNVDYDKLSKDVLEAIIAARKPDGK